MISEEFEGFDWQQRNMVGAELMEDLDKVSAKFGQEA